MPKAPPTFAQHTKKKRKKKAKQKHRRPYDKRSWRDGIRPAKLRSNPLCEHCEKEGRITPATEVDHIDGDNTNNEPSNLQSLCKPCHSRKTVKENGGFGT